MNFFRRLGKVSTPTSVFLRDRNNLSSQKKPDTVCSTCDYILEKVSLKYFRSKFIKSNEVTTVVVILITSDVTKIGKSDVIITVMTSFA